MHIQSIREKMVLQPGQPAPDFAGTALINGEFKDIKNADYAGKYVVLFFYPSDLYVPAIWLARSDSNLIKYYLLHSGTSSTSRPKTRPTSISNLRFAFWKRNWA